MVAFNRPTTITDNLPRGGDAIVMFVVFRDPLDYPGKYVVREQSVVGTAIFVSRNPFAVVDSLYEVHAAIPAGLTCLRDPRDKGLRIVETWL